MFPDRRASSRRANDLHGNKLTPWRATKNAFDLSAYFSRSTGLLPGRKVHLAGNHGHNSAATVKTPPPPSPVEKCPAAGIYIKRTVVLQNQFELLRSHLSFTVHLTLPFHPFLPFLPFTAAFPLTLLRFPRTSVCGARVIESPRRGKDAA